MKNKTYTIISGVLVEDTAPTVSVANGAIDTSEPVVSKKEQKKIVNKNRLKSFKEFCEMRNATSHDLLSESPEYWPTDREVNSEILNGIIEKNKEHAIHLGDGKYKIKMKSNHFVVFRKNKQGLPHSVSIFETTPTHLVHSVADKMGHASPEYIYKNIQDELDKGHEIHSDEKQSIGGSTLWKNMHTSVAYNQAFVMKHGMRTPVKNFYDKEGIFDPAETYIISK
jgi:hypothetical protein